jgi:hypothetical protein
VSAVDELVRAIEAHTGRPGRRVGKETRLLCPAHDDHRPSLDVAEGDAGRPLTKCRSHGCSFDAICAAVGLDPQRMNGARDDDVEWTPAGPAVAVYRYRDEDGRVLFEVCRTADKEFRQRRPDPSTKSGWRWNLAGVRRVLYRLPELRAGIAAGRTVWVVEGEKDVHALEQAGEVATCNPMGAGNRKWRPEYTEMLSGARAVVVVADRDEDGREHAERVWASVAKTVDELRIVEPAVGNDASDHLAAGGRVDEFTLAEPFRSRSRPYTEGNGIELPFRTLGEALRDAPEEPDWVVEGMVARTLVTAVGGRPKVGKTTLAFGLLRAAACGEPFLGGATSQTRALLLTEERHLTLNEKRLLFELADDDVHVLMRHEALADWSTVVEQAVAYCLDHDLGILVVDTWDKWAELRADAENNAGDTLANLTPLIRAAGAGLAVVIVAHQRKGDGKHGEALRGSNAFAGTVDVILELERDRGSFGEEGGRVLFGTSRLMSTPDKIALTWDRDTGVYVASDYDAVQLAVDKKQVAERLDDEERTKREIADRLSGMRAERLLAALNALVDDRVVFRTGPGVKGHPYRWRLRTDDDRDELEPQQMQFGADEAP